MSDISTAAERAEWIGQTIKIDGQPAVIIDALKWRNVWYLQYSQMQQ